MATLDLLRYTPVKDGSYYEYDKPFVRLLTLLAVFLHGYCWGFIGMIAFWHASDNFEYGHDRPKVKVTITTNRTKQWHFIVVIPAAVSGDGLTFCLSTISIFLWILMKLHSCLPTQYREQVWISAWLVKGQVTVTKLSCNGHFSSCMS